MLTSSRRRKYDRTPQGHDFNFAQAEDTDSCNIIPCLKKKFCLKQIGAKAVIEISTQATGNKHIATLRLTFSIDFLS